MKKLNSAIDFIWMRVYNGLEHMLVLIWRLRFVRVLHSRIEHILSRVEETPLWNFFHKGNSFSSNYEHVIGKRAQAWRILEALSISGIS